MAIQLTDKIHTVSTDIDTKNRGSAQANAGRDAYTLQEVKDVIGGGGGVTQITAGTNVTISPTDGLGNVTVNSTGGGGGIGGSITANRIAFGDTTADEITGTDDFRTFGDILFLGNTGTIRNFNNSNTGFGFYGGTLNFQVRVGSTSNADIDCSPGQGPRLYYLGNKKFQTVYNGVEVTGQMNLAALNTAPAANDSAGTLGEIRWTEGFVYICTLTGADGAANWNRATLTSGW